MAPRCRPARHSRLRACLTAATGALLLAGAITLAACSEDPGAGPADGGPATASGDGSPGGTQADGNGAGGDGADEPVDHAPAGSPPKVDLVRDVHDLGRIQPEARAERVFELHNTGGLPLNLEHLESKCACTVVTPEGFPVPPGGTGRIRADVLGPALAGRKHVRIILRTDDPVTPEVVLGLDMHVVPEDDALADRPSVRLFPAAWTAEVGRRHGTSALFTVRNEGGAPLRLTDLATPDGWGAAFLADARAAADTAGVVLPGMVGRAPVAGGADVGNDGTTATVPPAGEVRLLVIAPSGTADAADGAVTFTSDDPLRGDVRLPVSLRTPPPAGGDQVQLVVAAGQKGELAPCGCWRGQPGGLPRLGTVVERLRLRGSVVLVHAGDLHAAGGASAAIRARAGVRILRTLDCDAAAVGPADLGRGPAELQELHGDGPPLLGANLVGDDGEPRFATTTVAEHGPFPVGITAVLGAGAGGAAPPGLERADPAAAVAAACADLRARDCPVVVVLARVPPADLPDTAAAAESACAEAGVAPPDVWITAAGTRNTFDAGRTPSGARWIVWAGTGDAALRVRLTRDDDGAVRASPAPLMLGESLPDHAGAAAWTAWARAASAEAAPAERRPLSDGHGWAGSEACAPCHPSAYAVWRASRHADALDDLRARGAAGDPQCLACHTVGPDLVGGYGDPDGRSDAGPHADDDPTGLGAVGCESCHGPRAAHVADPTRTGAVEVARDCGDCHVPGHSPQFERERHWSGIAH